MVTHLPIRGKGFNMDYRTAFVIDFIKRRKPQEFYDHRTAEFVPLDQTEVQDEIIIEPSETQSQSNNERHGSSEYDSCINPKFLGFRSPLRNDLMHT